MPPPCPPSPRPSPAWTRTRGASRFLPLVALLLTLASCGSDDAGVDWGSPTSVFDAAMVAVSKADLDGLWPYLTPTAKIRVENDLRAWQLQLRDPEKGPVILAEVQRLRPETSPAELEAARTGTIADVWRFFLRAKPRPARPKKTGLRVEPKDSSVGIGYEDAHGTERVVVLTRADGRWRIEHLPL